MTDGSPTEQGAVDPSADPSPLRALWAARSIAIVGVSEKPGSLGRLPLQFLERYGYTGTVCVIHPTAQEVAGTPTYPSLTEAPEPIDLVMIMVGSAHVESVVDDCLAAGIRVAIICTSGFAETGEQGAELQHRIVAKARDGGLHLLGPNCIGSVGVATGQVSSFSPLFSGEHTELVDGPLGFVSQSGALCYGAVSLAFARGLGLGWVVNTGNEADTSAVDVMAAMAAEPGCRGLIGYAETLTDVTGLRDIVASGIPVAMLKAGRSEAGARAAASHTGALAAGDRVVDAALRQAGVVRVDDVDQLLDVAEVMTLPRVTGSGVAVVTTSGGSGILAADAMERFGLHLAELSAETTATLDGIVPAYGATGNPIDVTASVMSNSSLFDQSLDAIADDPAVDMILACFCVLTGKDVDDVVSSLERLAKRSGKPVLAVRTGADHLAPAASARMRAAGIPMYLTPERAVRALGALVAFSTPPSAFVDSPPDAEGAQSTGAAPSDVSEQGLKTLLAGHGIAVPGGRMATSADDAALAVAEVGGRAVVKAVVPGLLHKSDAGGVIVGVTAGDAPAAFDRAASLGGQVWVEEMVADGVEALVGVVPSPVGTVLTVGIGGVLTEVMNDVSLRILPVTPDDVEAMIDETRLGTLLAGVRGAGPSDRAAFVDAVCKAAELAGTWPPGFELDLNPITVLPEGKGVRVLDAAYSHTED